MVQYLEDKALIKCESGYKSWKTDLQHRGERFRLFSKVTLDLIKGG